MQTNPDCLKHLEALTAQTPLSPEVQAHLRTCAACQSIATNAGILRNHRSVYPPSTPDRIARIVDRLEPRLGSPSKSPLFSPGILPIAAALLFVGLLGSLLIYHQVTKPEKGFTLSLDAQSPRIKAVATSPSSLLSASSTTHMRHPDDESPR